MIYAVSDLHGQYNTFLAGLEKIQFSEEDQLYVLGDVIDRGPDGIELLQHIKSHYNMDLLIGDHELMMLNSVDPDGKAECNGPDTTGWITNNGGGLTFERYCGLDLDERLELINWMKERYVIRLLDINGKLFCLMHSFFKPEYVNARYSEMPYQDVWEIVWKSMFRVDFLLHTKNIYRQYDYTFITGHVPVQIIREDIGYLNPRQLKAFKRWNLINIDGGCGLTRRGELMRGALFICLDDMKEFPIRL
ncbi:serine/threonine protein phosphatase 1 [Lachnospiraceae bacterium XBB2008]|nr:serine/threonine protein phosphatase 1 [Lachnospiraceae bacterium XBB2008]